MTSMLAAVAVATVAGAGAVLAAQNHRDSSATPLTADGAATQPPNQFQAQEVIQQWRTSWNGRGDQGAEAEESEHDS